MQYMFENKGKWLKQFNELRHIDKDNVVSSGDKFFHKIYSYEVAQDANGNWHRKDVTNDKMLGELSNAEANKEASIPYKDLSLAEQKNCR